MAAVCELQTSDVGPAQMLQFLVLTNKSTAFGDKNAKEVLTPLF